MNRSERKRALEQSLGQRILILDGAMGSMIQGYGLEERDFRGERFADHAKDLQGNGDVLTLTRPEVIREIHANYLEAGSDIIGTNAFSATGVAQGDYALEPIVYELNRKAAELALEVCAEFTLRTPDKPRFVAGSIGPTNKTLSISPDVDDPALRALDFDTLREAYAEQARGLIDGGCDVLLIETIFDTLNAKAAIVAIQEVFEEQGRALPLMQIGRAHV